MYIEFQLQFTCSFLLSLITFSRLLPFLRHQQVLEAGLCVTQAAFTELVCSEGAGQLSLQVHLRNTAQDSLRPGVTLWGR